MLQLEAIRAASIFQSGMVLQRRTPICIWGQASGADAVRVTLEKDTAIAAVESGTWRAYLPPREAAVGLTLTLSTPETTITFNDVAVGEVWIAAGQSNMEFLLQYDAEFSSVSGMTCPDIRCFEVPKLSFPEQLQYYSHSEAGFWRKVSPADNPYFTAVGFYFAERLHETLQIPVGILNCTWGGTSASCWLSEEYLTGELRRFLERGEAAKKDMQYDDFYRFVNMQQDILRSGFNMGTPHLEPMEPFLDQELADQVQRLRLMPFSPFRPCGLYHMMVQTMVPYSVKGVLWYQGESDTADADIYAALMRAMIRCWRDDWQADLPFLMVQLASFAYMSEALDFGPIRAVQEALARTEPNVYLVTAFDTGMEFDIHPKEKRPVGVRLALQALDKVYGMHMLADSPTVLESSRQQDTVTIRFKHTGGGLSVRGETPETFDIWADGIAVSAFDVQVLPRCIQIQSAAFADADTVTIAYCQRPWCQATLENSAGLPVLPFSVDVRSGL